MLSYSLSAELIQQLRDLNNAFAVMHGRLMQYSEETKVALHRYAKISMIGASTRIENAVLTDAEIDWMDTVLTQNEKPDGFPINKEWIEDKLNKDKERSIEEVAGCRAMLTLIYSQAKELMPLSETTIRGLHQALLQYYPKASSYLGRYKKISNSVVETRQSTGQSRVVFETAGAGPITDAAMRDLVIWYHEAAIKSPWSVAIACEFTYRFLAIHPFQDGNGRLGRGLFLLALLQSPEEIISTVTPYLAIDRQIERRKAEYYVVLNRCSEGVYRHDPTHYHIEYFLQFMVKVLRASLDDIDIYKKRFEACQRLSESAHIILACFKDHPEVRLSIQQLVDITHLPRRTIGHGLSTLTKENLIQKYGQKAGVRYQLTF
ncbi:MAG: Fic family protein [Gammaproteobacteria bacterium]|nr:Fic family protein [Gammaproteobacteria bacterium]